MKHITLPILYQLGYYARLLLFVVCVPLLFALWFPAALLMGVLAIVFTLHDRYTHKDIHNHKHLYLNMMKNFWSSFIPFNKNKPLEIEGLPLNYFELSEWLSEVRMLNSVEHSGAVTVLNFNETLVEALLVRFPKFSDTRIEREDKSYTLRELIWNDKITEQSFVRTITEAKFLDHVESQLKSIKSNRG